MGDYQHNNHFNILMVAAENGALAGGKVGGLGDVIRDLPIALSRAGQKVSVITPGYGALAVKNSQLINRFAVTFSNRRETVTLYQVKSNIAGADAVTYWVLEHALFSAAGIGKIYSNDHYGPFATDAYKFALFNIAVCEALKLGLLGDIDMLHCHDWHSSLSLVLREYASRYKALKKIPAVFSIHNLALQGIRPLRGDDSSLEAWLPDLPYGVDKICHPFDHHCINFMRAGITLADAVQTVSPTYAQEILESSNPEKGFIGGEGLEQDLRNLNAEGRLIGILNGCEYPVNNNTKPTRSAIFKLIDKSLEQWSQSASIPAGYYFALRHLNQWQRKRKAQEPVLVSIGRMSEQKLGLLCDGYGDHSVMDEILGTLGDGIYIMLGSGEERYERFFTEIMARHANFIYLQGFSEALSSALYSFGDLFVMPSCYEPCGISQMLAMRAGQPCFVHATGGLKDTVQNLETGFSFDGDTRTEKNHNLVTTFKAAIDTFQQDPPIWKKLSSNAKAKRFSWDKSAQQYIAELYAPLNAALDSQLQGLG